MQRELLSLIVVILLVGTTLASHRLDNEGCLKPVRAVAESFELAHTRSKFGAAAGSLSNRYLARTICEHGASWVSYYIMGYNEDDKNKITETCVKDSNKHLDATGILEAFDKNKFGVAMLGFDPNHYMAIEKFTHDDHPYYRVYQQYVKQYSMHTWTAAEKVLFEKKRDVCIYNYGQLKAEADKGSMTIKELAEKVEKTLKSAAKCTEKAKKMVAEKKCTTEFKCEEKCVQEEWAKAGLSDGWGPLFTQPEPVPSIKDTVTSNDCPKGFDVQHQSFKAGKEGKARFINFCTRLEGYKHIKLLVQHQNPDACNESFLEKIDSNPFNLKFESIQKKYGGGVALDKHEFAELLEIINNAANAENTKGHSSYQFTGIYSEKTKPLTLRTYCVWSFSDRRCETDLSKAVEFIKNYTEKDHKKNEPALPEVQDF